MIKPINPGEFRHQITVIPTESTNVNNHATVTELEPFTIRGRIKPLTGRKYFEAAATYHEVTDEITVRYHPNINKKCLLKCNGKEYSIDSIADLEDRHVYLIILCKAVV